MDQGAMGVLHIFFSDFGRWVGLRLRDSCSSSMGSHRLLSATDLLGLCLKAIVSGLLRLSGTVQAVPFLTQGVSSFFPSFG